MTEISGSNIEEVGQFISGIRIDEHRFVAVMPFARLMGLVQNPLAAANPKFREAMAPLSDYYALHDEIQRAFDKGKRDNAEAYADYIVRIKHGDNGDTPSIDLFSPEKLHVQGGEGDQKHRLVWPYGLIVVPYDGETQLAARWLAAQKNVDTKSLQVLVTVTHGKSVEFARQCFHDRNAFQRRASVGVAMAMDSRDPLITVVRKIEAEVPGVRGQILWQSRQMPQKGKDHIAAAPFIRTAVACCVQGISGVQNSGAVPLPEDLSEEEFSGRALMWFGLVIAKVGPYMRDRENYIASAPAIWAALGALGKPLADPALSGNNTLRTVADGLLAKLNGVDWRKNDNWIGIAIKATTGGGYSFAGGAKDSGSIAYKALTDSSDTNFQRIRPALNTAAA